MATLYVCEKCRICELSLLPRAAIDFCGTLSNLILTLFVLKNTQSLQTVKHLIHWVQAFSPLMNRALLCCSYTDVI